MMGLPNLMGQVYFPMWLRLLRENSFDVDASLRRRALSFTAGSLLGTALGALQRLRYGGVLARTPVRPPLFVIGHWRSGTTWLFDLLAQDGRFGYPTHMTCAYAQHFLLTRPLIDWMSRRIGQATRAVDSVPTGPYEPKEDEFALCALGAPSPYFESIFPNRRSPFLDYLSVDDAPLDGQAAWRRTFMGYLQALTYFHRKPLLLKSPTHTARLRVLSSMFPTAKFVHIVRNPYDIYPSMLKTLKAMAYGFGLQQPQHVGLEEHVLDLYVRVMSKVDAGRPLVAPGHYFELRYEDLVADPMGRMRDVYEQLALGGWDAAEPRIRAYLQRLGPNTAPRHAPLDGSVRARLEAAWGPYIARYGYSVPTD